MRLSDAPVFAAGLDMELPYCPLPLIQAARLFWQLDPIRVTMPSDEREAAPELPLNALTADSALSDTRH
jgi:hypothetical protein